MLSGKGKEFQLQLLLSQNEGLTYGAGNLPTASLLAKQTPGAETIATENWFGSWQTPGAGFPDEFVVNYTKAAGEIVGGEKKEIRGHGRQGGGDGESR